ncbi:hypothetical protein ACUXI2_002456, partial [Staphylococcus capitis]
LYKGQHAHTDYDPQLKKDREAFQRQLEEKWENK